MIATRFGTTEAALLDLNYNLVFPPRPSIVHNQVPPVHLFTTWVPSCPSIFATRFSTTEADLLDLNYNLVPPRPSTSVVLKKRSIYFCGMVNELQSGAPPSIYFCGTSSAVDLFLRY